MKKSLLIFIALLLTAAMVTATVLRNSKRSVAKNPKECCAHKAHCTRLSNVACY